MFSLQRVSKLTKNLSSLKNNFERCPKRCESFLSTSRQLSTLKNVAKASLVGMSIGFPVGVTLTMGYNWYANQQAVKISRLEGKEQKIMVLPYKPTMSISKHIVVPTDTSGLKLTLYQYQTCPFCCKVRTFLDYYGVSYNVVEVDPVLHTEIQWSSYKKVPIVLAEVNSGFLQLNDSTMIISLLASHLKDKSKKVYDLAKYYPSIAMRGDNQTLKYETMNKYFLMHQEKQMSRKQTDESMEERKWRKWADEVLVHTISPNVYRTLSEAYGTFTWFSEVGEWEKYFPKWERVIIHNVGATSMWLISKRLKKKYGLKDDVRQSLYDEINYWLNAIKKRNNGQFMGGEKPDLSDLAVFGILSSMHGCDAFKDALDNTKLGSWYYAVEKEVQAHSGGELIATK